jgi:hypothetical protein
VQSKFNFDGDDHCSTSKNVMNSTSRCRPVRSLNVALKSSFEGSNTSRETGVVD